MNRRLRHVLVSVGCVGLVVGSVLSPAGRWAGADDPTCVSIPGGEACTVPPQTVPPVVATGEPPVRGFEVPVPAGQAPYTPVDPNETGGRP